MPGDRTSELAVEPEQEVVPKGYLVLGPIPGQGRVGPKPVEVQRSGMPDPSHSGCEPRPRVRLTRLGRGPGAEGGPRN